VRKSSLKTSPSLRQQVLRWSRRLVLVGIALYGLAMISGLVLTFFPEYKSKWELARTAFWLMMLPVPIAVLLTALLRSRLVLLILLPPLLAWSVEYIPQFMPKFTRAPEGSQELTLLSFNILADGGDTPEALDLILAADADIVALQELSLDAANYLQENLAEEYPYSALHGQQWNSYRGQGIFSRYPILEDEYWIFQEFARKSHGQQRTELDINGQPIVIYNAHPWPPFEWRGGLNFHFSSIPDTAHNAAIVRLLALIDEETEPVLLVGDLNTSPYYEEFRWMTERLTDSFREAGVGLGLSYPACGVGFLPIPLIQIDHVLHSDEFTALDAEFMDGCSVSDHHALLVRLAVQQGE